MDEEERLRHAARQHGVVSVPCQGCAWKLTCGGIQPERPLFDDCFDLYCCKQPDSCDDICPYNSDFQERMEEVGGLRFDEVASLNQWHADLPRYVPLIHHGYSHRKVLDLPVVALETYQVFRLRDGKYRTLATDGSGLRKEFGLLPTTKVILRGTARDRPLEHYWSYRRRDQVAEQIKSLDVMMAIAPNYSHFLDVVRTDNLFNRKRQLICVTELEKTGVLVVPHLSATTSNDWQFWQSYVRRNESVKFVAVEFQTGNKNFAQGRAVIERVAAIQNAVNRHLHPVVIGGTQYVKELVGRFDTFTLIDSSPFIKAVKRQKFEETKRRSPWSDTYTLDGQGVEEVILKNVRGHSAWIDGQCSNPTTRKEGMAVA